MMYAASEQPDKCPKCGAVVDPYRTKEVAVPAAPAGAGREAQRTS
jgi:hypothetical protein